MHHLKAIGLSILKEHGEDMRPVENPKALIRYIKSDHCTRPLSYRRNGDENWGDDQKWDYQSFRQDFRLELITDYPIDRMYWLNAFRFFVRGGFKPDLEWLSMYAAMLGTPYPEFPRHLNWKTLLYHTWLQEFRKFRDEWKKAFVTANPDTAKLNIFKPRIAAVDQFESWKVYAYQHGLPELIKLWTGEALIYKYELGAMWGTRKMLTRVN